MTPDRKNLIAILNFLTEKADYFKRQAQDRVIDAHKAAEAARFRDAWEKVDYADSLSIIARELSSVVDLAKERLGKNVVAELMAGEQKGDGT